MEKNDRESGEKGGAKEWMKFSSALPLPWRDASEGLDCA
jgi:hypothetical protein